MLRAIHEAMVDMRDHLVLLILERRANHHENHRSGPAGLLVNFLDVRMERDFIAGMYRRDELDVLARVKSAPPEARDMLEKMPSVAERHCERRRRDNPAVRAFLRRLRVGEERIVLAERRAKARDLLGLHLDRIGILKDLVDYRGIEIDHRYLVSTATACGTALR